MWGNDPQFARTSSGKNPNGPLTETWINPQSPAFARDTLGWGGRLAGPLGPGECLVGAGGHACLKVSVNREAGVQIPIETARAEPGYRRGLRGV
jgi:hypothetical protein